MVCYDYMARDVYLTGLMESLVCMDGTVSMVGYGFGNGYA